jgi:2-dehydro-3-deoxyphosphogalactonate aldolase
MHEPSGDDERVLNRCLARCPLIAILRGIEPAEAPAVTEVLDRHGFTVVEVPLNSPRPFDSIREIASGFGDRMLVGAGTVTDPDQVARVTAAGGRLVVMPHFDPEVVGAAKSAGLFCVPGVATPSEAYAALRHGADGLKIFPAQSVPPAVLAAWRQVLPAGTLTIPVGGIDPDRLQDYWAVGARGFGIGTALYAPGKAHAEVAAAARRFVSAAAALR